MLAHDLVAALSADRERAIRDTARLRLLAARPSRVARVRARLSDLLRPDPGLPPARSSRRLAHGLGDVAGGVSGRAGGTHGQGAC